MKTLYVSDLDGTLLNSDKKVSEHSVTVINEAVKNGALFTVATARSFVSALDLTNNLDINAPMVLMNGVFIYDKKDNKFLKYESISKENISRIIKFLKSKGETARMFAFDGEKMIVYVPQDYKASYSEDQESKYRQNIFVDNLEDYAYKDPIVSFVLIDTYEKLEPIYNGIMSDNNFYCCFYNDIYHPEVYWLEIYDSNVSKAKAVDYVKKYIGADSLTAFGDQINDIEMLRHADNAICVANAANIVKKEADIVLELSNNEDAVADYIGKIFGGK